MEAMKEALMPILEETADNEMLLMMNKGVCHKEEDLVDMVQSLIIDDTCLNENNEAENKQKIPQHNDNDTEMEQMDDEEDGSENVQQDEEMDEGDNYIFAGEDNPRLDHYKWGEPNGLASRGDTYTEYNWCSEEDMKVWEWSEYTCTHPI